jgi:hypothetical protein
MTDSNPPVFDLTEFSRRLAEAGIDPWMARIMIMTQARYHCCIGIIDQRYYDQFFDSPEHHAAFAKRYNLTPKTQDHPDHLEHIFAGELNLAIDHARRFSDIETDYLIELGLIQEDSEFAWEDDLEDPTDE